MQKDEKKHRKDILHNLKEEERSRFVASLPVSQSEIKALFDYLGDNAEDCDDTLRQTVKFIKEKDLPEKETILWLNEHGGFCDCEVIANVEDEWDRMIG